MEKSVINKNSCPVLCSLHSGIVESVSNIEKNLSAEIKERKIVYRNLQEDLNKKFSNIYEKMNEEISNKYKLMDIQIENCKSSIELKFESFKREINEKMSDFKKIAITFFIATITLWGSVVGLMILLYNNGQIK